MCMACSSDPSPSCMGACSKSVAGTSQGTDNYFWRCPIKPRSYFSCRVQDFERKLHFKPFNIWDNKNPKFKSLMDLIVRPYCHSCALAPTASCWEKCNSASRFATETETPAVYCMQCASDPSPTCMGGCAKSVPKPQPRCMQCASDPSPTCMGACGLSTIMMEYESPISFCMQCASDPSPTCMGGCVRGLKIENWLSKTFRKTKLVLAVWCA